MKRSYLLVALVSALSVASAAQSETQAALDRSAKSFSGLDGRVVLDNEHVFVQAFTVNPGQSTGTHAHRQAQMLVFVHGGVLRSEGSGRSVLWRDGRVIWLPPSKKPEEARRNVGPAPIDFTEVTLKLVTGGSNTKAGVYGYLSYPNVAGEDLLENDQVIVQHFALDPGQWEGVHAHNPNTLYIFIKGSQWLSKTTNPPSETRGNSPDGDVGWMQAYDITAGHQSGNVGTATSEVVWIALKH